MVKKDKFPMLPEKNWWILRNKFKQTVPVKVTVGYLLGVLGVGEKTAGNIIPDLKIVGLINEDLETIDLANRWRLDEEYSSVCGEIKKNIYPDDLISAFSGKDPDKNAVKNWFKSKTRLGESAANRMANFFILISEADYSKGADLPKSLVKKKKQGKKKVAEVPKESKSERELKKQKNTLEGVTEVVMKSPTIHIDVQIHLSPESSSNQIDQIFASMAKHLKEFYKTK